MCLLSPSVSRQMDVCFFSKELNLNCLHCTAATGIGGGQKHSPGDSKHCKREQDEVMVAYSQAQQTYLCCHVQLASSFFKQHVHYIFETAGGDQP